MDLTAHARTSLLLAVAAIAAAALPQAAAAAIEARQTTVDVRPGRLANFVANCPEGSFALAGGVRGLPAEKARVAGSIPKDDGSWVFTIDTRTATTPSPVTAFVTCLSLPSPPRGYAVEFDPVTVKQIVHLERDTSADVTLSCPAGYRPTDYGLQWTGGIQPTVAALSSAEDVSVVSARMVGTNVGLSLANSGLGVDATAAAQCVPAKPIARTRRARRAKRSVLGLGYRSVVQSSPEPLSGGDNPGRRRTCATHRRGKRRVAASAVSTWAELPAQASVVTSFVAGRDGVWNVFAPQGGQANLQVLCQSVERRWR